MKRCPFCAEFIHDDAIKCKYCRELLVTPEEANLLLPPPPVEEDTAVGVIRCQYVVTAGEMGIPGALTIGHHWISFEPGRSVRFSVQPVLVSICEIERVSRRGGWWTGYYTALELKSGETYLFRVSRTQFLRVLNQAGWPLQSDDQEGEE